MKLSGSTETSIWNNYRGDVARLKQALRGGEETKGIQDLVVEGFGEVFGPVYSAIDYLNGDMDTKSSRLRGQMYLTPKQNKKVSDSSKLNRKFKDEKIRDINYFNKHPQNQEVFLDAWYPEGHTFKSVGGVGTKAELEKKGKSMRRSRSVPASRRRGRSRSRGRSKSRPRSRSFSRRRSRSRRGRRRSMSVRGKALVSNSKSFRPIGRSLGGRTVTMRLAFGSIVQNMTGIVEMKTGKLWGAFNGVRLTPVITVTDGKDNYQGNTGDVVIPFCPTMSFYWNNQWTAIATIYREYKIRSVFCEYVTRQPTTSAATVMMGYAPDVQNFDVGSRTPQEQFLGEDYIKNLPGAVVFPAWKNVRLPIRLAKERGWYFLRNAYTVPAFTCLSNNVDPSEMRQSNQGLFMTYIVPDGTAATVLGDLYFTFTISFRGSVTIMGSNTSGTTGPQCPGYYPLPGPEDSFIDKKISFRDSKEMVKGSLGTISESHMLKFIDEASVVEELVELVRKRSVELREKKGLTITIGDEKISVLSRFADLYIVQLKRRLQDIRSRGLEDLLEGIRQTSLAVKEEEVSSEPDLERV